MRPQPMSPEEFKCLQRRSGMTNKKLAEWLGVSERAVETWRAQIIMINGPVARLMRMAWSQKEQNPEMPLPRHSEYL